MKFITLLAMSLIMPSILHAQAGAADGKTASLVQIEDELLKNLNHTVHGFSKPKRWKGVVKVPIKVTTEQKDARYFTRQGFGLMQNQWDFEAHRSFVEALNHDSQCLGAYTGLLMASRYNHNLSHAYYLELITRVDGLKNKRVAGKNAYSKQEILYADIALAMAEKKKAKLAELSEELTKSHKLDFLARIMKEIFFAPKTENNTLEKKAEYIELMMSRHPYNTALWVYFEQLHAYNTDPVFIKEKLLPVARNLLLCSPEIPVVQLKYAICLQKSGMHKEADVEFKKALRLYSDWGIQSRIPAVLNDGIWKVKIYQVMSLYHQGEFDKAIKMARELQVRRADIFSISEVRGINLWEVQTLPARLYLARGAKGDLVKARDSLPDKDFCAGIEDISAAPIYYKALIQYIAFRMSIRDGMKKEAEDLKLLFDETNQEFKRLSKESGKVFIDKNYFYRGKIAVTIYHNHINAMLERIYNDRQRYESFMQYAEQKLDSRMNLSILPRHVIEDVRAKKWK